jgi:hypothetical protein
MKNSAAEASIGLGVGAISGLYIRKDGREGERTIPRGQTFSTVFAVLSTGLGLPRRRILS